MKNFPRICGVYSEDSASSVYRIIRPFKAMKDSGYPVGYLHIDDLDDRLLPFYDAFVLNRTGNGDPEKIKWSFNYAKSHGKLIILDYDDDVLRVPSHNPGKPHSVDGIITALNEANGVVVTNPVLAASFRPYNKNISVIPNYMEPQAWPRNTPRYSEKLTVGVVGTASHIKDWEIIAEPMFNIRQNHDVEFLVGGFLPDYLKPSVSIEVQWVPLNQYPYIVNSIDIALCPLVDDHFNRCKSPIKSLEAGLAASAIVASPTQYQDTVRGRGTIARTEQEWEAAIEKYILDGNKRFIAGTSMRTYVERRWDVYRHVEQIANTYRDLYYKCLGKMKQVLVA
jgi:glycosyltransferase involved in cell wall biosynthesis